MVGISQNSEVKYFDELSIELTNKCSLNCIYCSSNASIYKETHLDLDRIKEIIEETCHLFHIKKVSLSGGEPFLYPYFWDLFNFLASKDLDIILYTSGLVIEDNKKNAPLPEKILSNLSKYGKIQIIMNIQGHNQELIEKINNTKDSYPSIIKTIERIRKYKIPLGAHIVPFVSNMNYLPDIVNFSIDHGFSDLNFLRFVPQGRGSNGDLYCSRNEFLTITKTIMKILERKDVKIRLGHPINFIFLFDKKHPFITYENHFCRGGLDAPLIQPNGDVCMCPAWKNLKQFKAGNIYDENMYDIWNSSTFKIFRNFIEDGYRNISSPCRECEYLTDCRGKCVAQRLLAQDLNSSQISLEEAMKFSPDPQCFKDIRGK